MRQSRSFAIFRIKYILFIVLLLAGTNTSAQDLSHKSADSLRPTVILVSIDGFRADYMQRFHPPALTALFHTGAHAKALLSCFPSKTFPNHYSIVTGLYPEHHGIIANTIFDPSTGATFKTSDDIQAHDPAWWGGEPLWVTAEKQGQHSGTMFWPGADVAIAGVRPSHWERYDKTTSNEQRVDKILEWIDLPSTDRPNLFTLYFDEVDTEGHHHGPASLEVEAAVAHVDRAVARLMDGLKQRNIYDRVNVIIVSDHGMVETPKSKIVKLDRYIDMKRLKVIDASPLLQAYPTNVNDLQSVMKSLKKVPHFHVYMKSETPEHWHYRSNPRITPIVGLMDEGWTLTSTEALQQQPEYPEPGNHGFDPKLKSMHALFIAHGPSFQAGSKTGDIVNIDVEPLIVHILGLLPPPVDGHWESFRSVLVH